ncbi:MAG: bifunctional glycoside hydrolase 114/ polysaccharide deacetylase family protein [Granulosicoccus sp.]
MNILNTLCRKMLVNNGYGRKEFPRRTCLSLRTVLCFLLIPLMSACVTDRKIERVSGSTEAIPVYAHQRWQLSDLDNATSSATAPQTVTTLLQTHLQSRGIKSVTTAKFTDRLKIEGEVQSWHYQYGAASRPQIDMRIDVRDMAQNIVIRSDRISDTGSRSESLTMLADRLLASYVKALPLDIQADAVPGQLTARPDTGFQGAIGDMPVMANGSLAVRNASGAKPAGGLFETVRGIPSLAGRSAAFYYGADPAIDELSQFDRIILEPDNISATQLKALTAQGAQAYAYVSVGEVGKHRSYARQMKPEWIMGSNPAWQSAVLDLANHELRSFLLNRVGELARQGYQGVFLDTMDSFNIVADTPEQKKQQRAGLVELIVEFARAYPKLSIIANRGFEVLDDIAIHLDAVVAESLYAGWNNEKAHYVEISEDDRRWLLTRLEHVKNNLDLEVIVIDYVAPAERDNARQVARRIARHGFVPWVANPELDYLGIGAQEVIPRKVLMLYNGADEGQLKDSFVHRYIAMPIEYLGYVPEYLDVSGESLPEGVLKGRYAGIVSWTQEPVDAPALRSWLIRQMKDRVPVAFFGAPPVSVDSTLAKLMGVSVGAMLDARSAKLAFSDDMIKPERRLSARVDNVGVALKNQQSDSQVHMRYRDDRDTVADVVVTGKFGGYALNPGVFQDELDYGAYWVVDPFRFLETALQLPRVPQPDVTTENGRRLWLAHIDGDALPSWAEMPGRRLGADVIYDQLLSQYKLPHTVSVVEGEMTEDDRVSDRRDRMFDIARRTFELDHVELASHTYSHPFFWAELGKYRKSGRFNLPIDGYRFNAEREVAGSIDFINRNLAPKGKKVKVMLWSGDAFPREEDLAVVDRLGLVNMNGGFTAITNDQPTMTRVTAMARPVGAQLQVYAPIMNENVYTDNWRGPFDGFRKVIDTFQLTDQPRRLKPVNIYYHFYSGTKVSAMRALSEVYAWSIAQDIFPVYVSDYASKVPDFRQAGVARYLDGRWKMTRLGNVRSLRVLGEGVYPRLPGSQGVTGARKLHDGVYFHTDGSDKLMFKTSTIMGDFPHLVSSNGQVRNWTVSSESLAFRIAGEVPVSIELGGSLASTCALNTDAGVLRGEPQPTGTLRFTFTEKDTGNVTLNCPA